MQEIWGSQAVNGFSGIARVVSAWGAGAPCPQVPPHRHPRLAQAGGLPSATVAQTSCGTLLPTSRQRKMVEVAVFANTHCAPAELRQGAGSHQAPWWCFTARLPPEFGGSTAGICKCHQLLLAFSGGGWAAECHRAFALLQYSAARCPKF